MLYDDITNKEWLNCSIHYDGIHYHCECVANYRMSIRPIDIRLNERKRKRERERIQLWDACLLTICSIRLAHCGRDLFIWHFALAWSNTIHIHNTRALFASDDGDCVVVQFFGIRLAKVPCAFVPDTTNRARAVKHQDSGHESRESELNWVESLMFWWRRPFVFMAH